MLLIFANLILLRFSFQVEKNTRSTSAPFSFGFQKGGSFQIEITNNRSDSFIILLGLHEEIDEYFSLQNLYRPCNITIPFNYFKITEIGQSTSTFSGVIKTKGKYNITILSCDYFHQNFSITLSYKNPNSFLSYDVQKILIYNPIIVSISALLFIVWMINWKIYFSMKNNIHWILTISFLMFVLQKIAFLIETIDNHKSNNISKYYEVRKYFRFLHCIYLFTALHCILSQLLLNAFKKYQCLLIFVFVGISYYLAIFLVKFDSYDYDPFKDKQWYHSLYWPLSLYVFVPLNILIIYNDIRENAIIYLIFSSLISLIFFFFHVFNNETEIIMFNVTLNFMTNLLYIITLTIIGFIFRMGPNVRNDYLNRFPFLNIENGNYGA